MKYELAKELKDAGFPQNDYLGSRFITELDQVWQRGADTQPQVSSAYIPTLEEVIDACGVSFDKLFYRPTGTNMEDGKGSWYAVRSYPDGFPDTQIRVPQSRGATPTEAVANLWLALNAK